MSTDPASMIAEMRQRTSLADLCEQLALDKLAPYIDEASDAGEPREHHESSGETC